jgi:hypothetical protein
MGKGREERRVRSESVSYSMLNLYSHCHQFTFMALKSMISVEGQNEKKKRKIK